MTKVPTALLATLLPILLSFPRDVSAEQYKDDVIVLEIPAGFVGPTQVSPAPQAKTLAYTKSFGDKNDSTSFQITEFDMGEALLSMPKNKRGESADFYVKQLLSGVERRRTHFAASEPERIVLGGLPASRVSWEGEVDGRRASGIMYCVVIRSVVVSFHTQSVVDAPPENRTAAMRAIENVVIQPGG